MKKIILLVLCSGLLNGCVGFFISQATQAAVETVKVPFKIGGAVYDAVSGADSKNGG